MSTYPQQHEPWRPDYPPVWNVMLEDDDEGLRALDMTRKPLSRDLCNRNMEAFTGALIAIDKAMKQ